MVIRFMPMFTNTGHTCFVHINDSPQASLVLLNGFLNDWKAIVKPSDTRLSCSREMTQQVRDSVQPLM